jgi:hypothetical protein
MFKTGQFSVIENVIFLVLLRNPRNREYGVSWAEGGFACADAVVALIVPRQSTRLSPPPIRGFVIGAP